MKKTIWQIFQFVVIKGLLLVHLCPFSVFAQEAASGEIQKQRTPGDSLSKFILTPSTPETPRINGPKVFGVRPGSPFLYSIPATGKRPMKYSADNLPSGLKLDKKSGRITGTVKKKGEFTVTLCAKNSLGKAERKFRIVAGDNISLTTPMGWNSWNAFGKTVDQEKVQAAADALVKTGLTEHGWSYVIIDGGWSVNRLATDPIQSGQPYDSLGRINANRKFPDMKGLGEYIHSKGLKFGIHTSPGPETCASGWTASYNHERPNAERFADWGVDYIKYDWCSYTSIARDNSMFELQKPFLLMRGILDGIRRDIVFSINPGPQGRKNDPWKWGKDVGANMWRTTGDINDKWLSVSRIGFSQHYADYAGPGHWNDPDMLVIGTVGWDLGLRPTKLTPDEQYTHVSLWCLLSAPLMIGCDLTKLDDFTISLLTNDEVLDIDQDSLGKQASLVSETGDLVVYSKPLEDGSVAVGLFNKGTEKAVVTANWADLKIKGKQTVRDLCVKKI
jgi:alpha-galactosidase